MAVTGGTEGANLINIEKTPVRPENGTGLHIAGGIEIGRNFYINTIQSRHPTFQFITAVPVLMKNVQRIIAADYSKGFLHSLRPVGMTLTQFKTGEGKAGWTIASQDTNEL